ncbi:I78 family peptidase inhibitor [Brevundimonas sp. FT23042]|uniref:I78 family peptidase inhibitor n=1 Tax=Brevundimonas sp. FT23042 TaxID=3393749 RepID=UPI003B58711B
MRTLMLSLAAAGLLSACAPMNAGDPAPTLPDDGLMACKADQYQRYVGRNRSELPATPAGETWRVTCTSCPVTMDYNPGRLNILYDEATGVIRQVKCG